MLPHDAGVVYREEKACAWGLTTGIGSDVPGVREEILVELETTPAGGSRVAAVTADEVATRCDSRPRPLGRGVGKRQMRC